MAHIYVITNIINGKQYVGKTCNSIENRFAEHISDSKKRKLEKCPLYSAINKYGSENFKIDLIELCDPNDASDREKYWIQKLNTYGTSGYNATVGGDGKMFFNHKQLVEQYIGGKTFTQIAQEFNCSPETVSNACKEYGIQTRTRIEETLKPTIMIDKNTNNEIVRFECLIDAAEYCLKNNIAHGKISTVRTHISEACRGKRKQAYGYNWSFI